MYVLCRYFSVWWDSNIITHKIFHAPYNVVTLFPAAVLITRYHAIQMVFPRNHWLMSLNRRDVATRRLGPLMHSDVTRAEKVYLFIVAIDSQTLEISQYSWLLDKSFLKACITSNEVKIEVHNHKSISFDKDSNNYMFFLSNTVGPCVSHWIISINALLKKMKHVYCISRIWLLIFGKTYDEPKNMKIYVWKTSPG